MPAAAASLLLANGATHSGFNTNITLTGGPNNVVIIEVFKGDSGTVGLNAPTVNGIALELLVSYDYPDPGNPGVELWWTRGLGSGTFPVVGQNVGGVTATSVIILSEFSDCDQVTTFRPGSVLAGTNDVTASVSNTFPSDVGDMVMLFVAGAATANATAQAGTTDEANLDFGSDHQLVGSAIATGLTTTLGYDYDAAEAAAWAGFSLMAPATGAQIVALPEASAAVTAQNLAVTGSGIAVSLPVVAAAVVAQTLAPRRDIPLPEASVAVTAGGNLSQIQGLPIASIAVTADALLGTTGSALFLPTASVAATAGVLFTTAGVPMPAASVAATAQSFTPRRAVALPVATSRVLLQQFSIPGFASGAANPLTSITTIHNVTSIRG